MVDKFKYENSQGEVIEFGTNGIFANQNDLRDYKWQYDTNKKSVTNFRKESGSKSLDVTIVGLTIEEAIERKNKFYETVEKDVIAETPGKLWIGDYYLRCYVTESSKSDYLYDNYLVTKASIVTLDDVWIKETRLEYLYHDTPDTTGRGYSYGYDYDYTIGSGNLDTIVNPHFAPCAFVLKLCGYASNPQLTIGGHVYRVVETVQKNEILTIDTVHRTIYLTKNNGVQVNTYAKRDRSSYIFEPIPAGEQSLYWNGEYNFEITLYEERGEPIWT